MTFSFSLDTLSGTKDFDHGHFQKFRENVKFSEIYLFLKHSENKKRDKTKETTVFLGGTLNLRLGRSWVIQSCCKNFVFTLLITILDQGPLGSIRATQRIKVAPKVWSSRKASRKAGHSVSLAHSYLWGKHKWKY